jgi:D-alanyl-D-alanine dipeptidase
MQKLDYHDFVPVNAFAELIADPVYSFAGNTSPESPLTNQFPGLYSPDAKIVWGHKNLIAIAVLAARICKARFGWRLRVADCLRPVEAQEKMEKYGYHPALVSKPGCGAHPRGMAIDLIPEVQVNGEWQMVEMGVPYDYFVDNPETSNPAARDYTRFDTSFEEAQNIYLNRQSLEFAVRRAAAELGHAISPLPQEWWDFRFGPDIFGNFAPLRESDLPPMLRLIDPDLSAVRDVLAGKYPDYMAAEIARINELAETKMTAMGL